VQSPQQCGTFDSPAPAASSLTASGQTSAAPGLTTALPGLAVKVVSSTWDYQDDPNALIVTFNADISNGNIRACP
jgi:hypothetical protein